MLTITQRLTKFPSLGLIRREIDQFMDEEEIRRKQFYEQITEDDKAEFINGQIIMHSPVRNIHSTVSFRLAWLLGNYVSPNDLGFIGHEKIMVEFTRNSYEPDICFFKPEKAKKFTEEQMIHPVPDFIVEVLSKSTESIDRNIKFKDYASHGVGEYWIILPKKKVIEKYICKNFKYELAGIFTRNDVITSEVVKGFEIEVNLVFDKEALDKFIAKDKVRIEEMEKSIEEKDKTIVEKDKAIEEKDKAIERLKQEIEKLKNK